MQRLLVKVVRDTGASTLLVTHDIDEALVVADRVLLLGSHGTLAGTWAVELQQPRVVHHDLLGKLRIQILQALQDTMSRAA